MRYAICNETFENWDHAKVCGTVAELGYEGLEIAPFTLAPRITDVTAAQRRQIKAEADKNGLKILGLHWLLAKTQGLMATAADEETRKRTADYFIELARCCRELGGWLLVFGSPAQRRVPEGYTLAQATEFFLDTLRRVLPTLEETKVKLCLEPLSPPDANFMNTAAEAVALQKELNHPQIGLHLDTKAMHTEDTPVTDVIRRYGKQTDHFHANDVNLRGPGFGNVQFKPIFQALKDSGYQGWVSVEVFDYTPDGLTIARESIQHMRACEPKN